MKLKAQIIKEAEAAHAKMRKLWKAAEDDNSAHDDAIYYEGMLAALHWVLESRNDETGCA